MTVSPYDRWTVNRQTGGDEADAISAELAAELRETRATLAEAQTKAAPTDSLEALVATERERLSDAKAERDRWAAQAEQLVATVDSLKNTIEALKAALDAEKGRLSELRESATTGARQLRSDAPGNRGGGRHKTARGEACAFLDAAPTRTLSAEETGSMAFGGDSTSYP